MWYRRSESRTLRILIDGSKYRKGIGFVQNLRELLTKHIECGNNRLHFGEPDKGQGFRRTRLIEVVCNQCFFPNSRAFISGDAESAANAL